MSLYDLLLSPAYLEEKPKLKPLAVASQRLIDAIVAYTMNPTVETEKVAHGLLVLECRAAQERPLTEYEMRYIDIDASLFLAAQLRTG